MSGAPPGAGPRLERAKAPTARGLDVRKQEAVVQTVTLKNLRAGETINVASLLGVTNDLASKTPGPGSYVHQGEHRYDIQMSGRVVLGRSASDTKGKTIARGGPYTVTPANHHGQYVQNGKFTVPPELDGQDMVVKLVAQARLKDAPGKAPKDLYNRQRPNMVDLGGKPLLTIDQHHANLDVLRVPPGAPRPERLRSEGPLKDHYVKAPSHHDQKHDKAVVMSIPLGEVSKGEVIDVDAWVRGHNETEGSTLLAGYVTLAGSAKGKNGQDVTSRGGANIPGGAPNQGLRKSGTIKVKQSRKQAFLNFVVSSGAGHSPTAPRGDLKVLEGKGAMNVRRWDAKQP